MENKQKSSILIATPCYNANIDSNTAGAIYAAGILLKEKNIPSGLYFVNNESYIPSARNRIAYEFMHSEFTHLMCIDADIGFKPQDIISLFDMDKEFAAATYSTKNKPSRLTVILSPGKENEAEYIGMGFVMLKKSVFERLAPKTEKIQAPSHWGNFYYRNFFGPIIKNKTLLTEDFSFCQRWRDIGGKIYLNKEIKLIHYGKFPY